MLTFLLYLVYVLTAFFLILVILLQQGEGADLSVFGGGATQTVFSSRGSTLTIHKITAWSFAIFAVLALVIGVYVEKKSTSESIFSKELPAASKKSTDKDKKKEAGSAVDVEKDSSDVVPAEKKESQESSNPKEEVVPVESPIEESSGVDN